MMRIYLPKLIQDILRWKPDVAFLMGLWTGVAICYIAMKVTARVILKYDLQPSPSMAMRMWRKRVCARCGNPLGHDKEPNESSCSESGNG
jgi:hypothetical protein